MTNYLTLLLFFLPGLMKAQADTTQYPFVAYWSKGDTYTFEVSKIKLSYKQDSLVKSDTTSYNSVFEVVDSTAEGYLIRYTFGDGFQSTEVTAPEITRALDGFDLSAITYTTNETGQFVALENWEEFARAMQAAFDEVIAQKVKEGGMDTSLFRQLMAPMVSAFTTEAGILNKVVSELQHLHIFYGYAYALGDTLRYEDSFANMYGGTPFPVNSELYVERASWSDNFVVMRHLNTLAPTGNDLFRETMGLVYPALLEKDPAAFDGMSMDIRDDNWYAFYYNPGIPAKIENDRWVTIRKDGVETVNQERLIIRWIE